MNVNLGIWDKLTKLVLFLLAVAGAVGILVWYMPVIQQNEALRKTLLHLDRQIETEEATARRLRTSIEAVTTDPHTVERLARERLGYARPGETVIRFDPPAAPPAPTPQSP